MLLTISRISSFSKFNLLSSTVSNFLLKQPKNYVTRFQSQLQFTTTAEKYKKKQVLKEDETDTIQEENSDDVQQYNQLLSRAQLLPDAGHQVLVIQPFVKWGPKKNELTTPDLMLEEAIALIDSLPKWRCVDSIKVPLDNLDKKQVFGSGKFETLQQEIRKNTHLSAVFVSINILRGIQKKELESAFGVPVFDRYSVVLQIFKERAKTHEAKLQVAFAEIPYLRSSLAAMEKGAKGGAANQGGGVASIGGSGETYFEVQLRVLERRESRIKSELEKLSKKRALLKQQRTKKEMPVVAVVGYTNAGKSTLIRALTGDASIEPRDALFATLDVTAHACRLPCNLSTVLIDTVGFISNIPTNLVAAFNATLQDAIDADILIHIQDASHPDREHQLATVNSTLEALNVDTTKSIIQVANKIDKLSDDERKAVALPGVILASAKDGTGLDELLDIVQTKLIEVTGRIRIKLQVPNGGAEYSWLCKEAAVIYCSASDDANYLNMDVMVTQAVFGRLKSMFPNVRMQKK